MLPSAEVKGKEEVKGKVLEKLLKVGGGSERLGMCTGVGCS